jgi:hypothetical protein
MEAARLQDCEPCKSDFQPCTWLNFTLLCGQDLLASVIALKISTSAIPETLGVQTDPGGYVSQPVPALHWGSAASLGWRAAGLEAFCDV